MQKRSRLIFGNNGESMDGELRNLRIFTASDRRKADGYKGWVDVAFKACYTPLLPIALPALLILLDLLLVERLIQGIKSRVIASGREIDRSAERKLKEIISHIRTKPAISRTGKEDEAWDRITDQEDEGPSRADLYVGNLSSETFHRPECRWAKKISEKNLIGFADKEEALSRGMTACKSCKP